MAKVMALEVAAVFGVALILVACSPGLSAVRIGQVQVPPPQANGSAKDVVLDCDYSLDGDETPESIVVKWFLNKETNPTPVYQWITNKIPQALGVLQGRLNLGYRATDQPSTRHRALNILHPTIELSGEYSCQVSSFSGEDVKSKKFIIYVPEENLELTQSKTSEGGQVRLSCEADGVFPRPELAFIRRESRNETVIDGAEVRVTDRKDGLFDIEADIVVDEAALEGEAQLGCKLTLEDTPYSVIAWEDYESIGGAATRPAAPLSLVLSTGLAAWAWAWSGSLRGSP